MAIVIRTLSFFSYNDIVKKFWRKPGELFKFFSPNFFCLFLVWKSKSKPSRKFERTDNSLTLSCIMMKNDETYIKNLAVFHRRIFKVYFTIFHHYPWKVYSLTQIFYSGTFSKYFRTATLLNITGMKLLASLQNSSYTLYK